LSKTLLYKLFRIGGIPKKLRPVLEQEGIRCVDEGIGGWVYMKNYRAPGKRFKYRATGFTGFLAATGKRVVAYTYWKPIINIPVEDPRLGELELELLRNDSLKISFEASSFDTSRQGRIEVRFKTDKASLFYSLIKSYQ